MCWDHNKIDNVYSGANPNVRYKYFRLGPNISEIFDPMGQKFRNI